MRILFQAVKNLTANLQNQLESLVLHTENEEQDQLLGQIETVLQSENFLPAKATFFRTQKMLKKIKALNEAEVKDLKSDGDQYFSLLEKEKINDLAVYKNLKKSSSWPNLFKLIFGFPLFLYGWINNFIAFLIPGFLAKKIKIYPGYRPAVMTIAGWIFLPIGYYIQTRLVNHYIDFPYIGWIYF